MSPFDFTSDLDSFEPDVEVSFVETPPTMEGGSVSLLLLLPFSGDRHTDIISNGHLSSRSRNQTTLVGCPRTSSKASLLLLWDSDTRLGLGLRSEKVNRHQKRLVKGRTLSFGLPSWFTSARQPRVASCRSRC